MFEILVKFTTNQNSLEFSSFEELCGLENYNQIKMLSIKGNPDDYYLKKRAEKEKKHTRIEYRNRLVNNRDGLGPHYAYGPVVIEVDSDDEELQTIQKASEICDYLPPYFTYPTSLVKFVLHSTNIVELPDMYHLTQLTTLLCLLNRLRSFPHIPESVNKIDISHNPITQLPTIPTGIKELYCDNCQLSKINTTLPDSLKILKCSNNQLKHIDYIPDSLEWLDCSINQLEILPFIPHSLVYINCSHNNIKGLPGSIYFSKLCNYLLYDNNTYQFHHIKVNYDEAKLIINNNPVCDTIEMYCDGNIANYILYKKAIDIIGHLFLEAKYNPKYKYCRDRLDKEFNGLYSKT